MVEGGERMLPSELIRTTWKVNPYLHVDETRIYNPLTDQVLLDGEPGYAAVRSFLATGEGSEALEQDGWIVRPETDLSARHRLKIVSLEMMTRCNQKCYFCPVSIAPREDYEMPEELFLRILEDLRGYRSSIEGVFLQSYNEPTLDRRFVEHCRAIHDAGLPVAVLSNASGLTPAKVDALIADAPLRYLCINLSTLDRERYMQDRGADHLGVVLRNLDYLRDKPLAAQMNLAVLGRGDEVHREDFERIREYFTGSRFDVQSHVVMDRAGWLDVGSKPEDRMQPLAGCDNIGSRPIQHLHVTPHGKCIFCCEDYDENYVIGDLSTHTIDAVLSGPEIARLRRWTYGVEEAPADFMCRDCVYARRS
jgi:hypothetical protein